MFMISYKRKRTHLKELENRESSRLEMIAHAMPFNIRLGKQNFVLGISVVFLVGFTLSLLERVKRNKTNVEQGRCWELNMLFQEKNLSGIIHFQKTDSEKEKIHMINNWKLQETEMRIMEHLLLAQECRWELNPIAVAQFRTQLQQCCNASFRFVTTKENIRLGSYIIFDGNPTRKLRVDTKLLDLLPEKSPFMDTSYRKCAVVGNGGILLNSSCGQEIDRADLVIRFNLPPMNFSEDIGTKTSLVTINPSILQNRFKLLQERRKPFVEALHSYSDATFLLPVLSFVGHNILGYRVLYTLEDFGVEQQAFFLNPQYLSNLANFWKKRGLKTNRLSSGFMLVSMALEFCQHITLYGFWPFSYDLNNQSIPHHYYDNMMPTPGVHAMPTEFSYYLSMYAEGVLRLRVGKCQ
uniref:ST8 alpha-N-acetyl-neuraminide alpha-2,8-sialyltransferase 6 n=2 Tax=Anolis carolinensis TaxID=28377 RepID=H9G8P7_ANOCA|nr:PREDICTED: alpha-N-acetylneuraminide alpha-2,8-sialyltransferase isoform X1 [Anolis carolinensis]|eukprot:XP_008122281.1 PREDICTED: alpha-N-acetylneuraminide alpha-2,8-sialyltransferase isoform X1 [Anolis carolinensis]